jgi:hypothetical protein
MLRSQEKTASVEVTPDAIATAKKDFESIKSARDASLVPQSGIPRVSLPELPGSSPPLAPGAKPTAIAPAAKSANWLLDAMEEKEAPREFRGKLSRSRNRESKSNSSDKKSGSVDQHARDAAEETSHENDRTAIVINPLTRFLDDWMTPQDYALLKPGLTQAFDPGVELKNTGSISSPALAASVSGIGDFGLSAMNGRSPVKALPASRDNPYLQSLMPELVVGVPTPGAKAVSIPPLISATPPAIAPPPPVGSTQTKIPEFAKPHNDDKYFKPLKRF